MTLLFSPARKAFILSVSGIVCLAGCGGGGSPTEDVDPPMLDSTISFTDAASSATSPLIAVALDSSARTTQRNSGTLNRADDTATIAGQTGSLNDNRTVMAIASGGQVTLTPQSGRFATRFSAAPQGANATTGIVGVPTTIADMPPGGTATLNGTSRFTAQVDQDLYVLNGTARTTANFLVSTVTTVISDLSGERTPALGDPTNVSNVGTLTLSSAAISGTGFGGGSVTSTGATLGLSGSQTIAQTGQFYGPDIAEAGGVFVINDITVGTTLIQGDFLVE